MKRHGLLGRMLVSGWALLLATAAAAQDGPILFDASSADEPEPSATDRPPGTRPQASPSHADRDNWPLDQGQTQSNGRDVDRGGRSAAQEQEKKYREWLNSRQNQRRTETQSRTGGSGATPERRDAWPLRYGAGTQGPGIAGPSQDRSPERSPNRLNRPAPQPNRLTPGSTSGRVGNGQPLLRNWDNERSSAGGAQGQQRALQSPDRGLQPWQRSTQPYERGVQPMPGGMQRQKPTTPTQQRSLQPAQRGWQSPQYDPSRTGAPLRVTPRGPAGEGARRAPIRDELWSDSSNQESTLPKPAQSPSPRNYQQRTAQPASPRTSALFDGTLRR